MQAASDIFLGFLQVKGTDDVIRDYYVRQLHDWKGGVEVETMRVPGAVLYGRMCASTLARAHARLGDRIAIASYMERATRSTGRSPTSRSPTPTRTSATSRPWSKPSSRAGFKAETGL